MGDAAQVPTHAIFVALCAAQTVPAAMAATTITLDQRVDISSLPKSI
jgi:hypothetical protein